jgi:protoheme ferro-lyase
MGECECIYESVYICIVFKIKQLEVLIEIDRMCRREFI